MTDGAIINHAPNTLAKIDTQCATRHVAIVIEMTTEIWTGVIDLSDRCFEIGTDWSQIGINAHDIAAGVMGHPDFSVGIHGHTGWPLSDSYIANKSAVIFQMPDRGSA